MLAAAINVASLPLMLSCSLAGAHFAIVNSMCLCCSKNRLMLPRPVTPVDSRKNEPEDEKEVREQTCLRTSFSSSGLLCHGKLDVKGGAGAGDAAAFYPDFSMHGLNQAAGDIEAQAGAAHSAI